jgi:high-affinity iron transporter
MRLIGPIVRNDLFFFVTMLALAGLMVLLEYRRRVPEALPDAANLSPAAIRKAAWSVRREKMWMSAVVVTSFLFIFLSTAEFIYAKSATALSPTTPVTLVGSVVTLPAADINDDKLHRFGVHVDDAKGQSIEVRFLLYKKPNGQIISVADACQICGPVGFYLSSQGIICKMCASPITPGSMGQAGGCNPIPLNSTITNGQLSIAAADLRALATTFEK